MGMCTERAQRKEIMNFRHRHSDTILSLLIICCLWLLEEWQQVTKYINIAFINYY
jgi:hypothetical protein